MASTSFFEKDRPYDVVNTHWTLELWTGNFTSCMGTFV